MEYDFFVIKFGCFQLQLSSNLIFYTLIYQKLSNYSNEATSKRFEERKPQKADQNSSEEEGGQKKNPVAANGGEDVEVAGVNEVENDGVDRALPLLEAVGHSVISLL